MSRRSRIHVPGGTYYIAHRALPNRYLFSQPEHYALIERLVPDALKHAGARLLGYCWMPDAIHLALRSGERPVGDFMREIAGRFSRALQRSTGIPGPLFHGRYRVTLIDPDHYLDLLIRYLHFLPVLAGLAGHPDQYRHSSHRAYVGGESALPVDTRPLRQRINALYGNDAPYHRLMTEPPPSTIGVLLERGRPDTPGILGDTRFVARLPLSASVRVPRPRPSVDQITSYVAGLHDLSPEHIRSRSRRHALVAARAQVAWYAVERRVATLDEVARYFRLSPSSLSRAIARHQTRTPELFTHEILAGLDEASGGLNGVFGGPGSPEKATPPREASCRQRREALIPDPRTNEDFAAIGDPR